MNDEIRKALVDLKARQEAGDSMVCPRCGRESMKPELYTNAMSREADGIMVCDECGTQEALLAFMHSPMPVEDWAFLQEDVPIADFRAYRREAMKRCPGLTQIWEMPFQAVYNVSDGQLMLRFRQGEDGVEITADLLGNGK